VDEPILATIYFIENVTDTDPISKLHVNVSNVRRQPLKGEIEVLTIADRMDQYRELGSFFIEA
jgi:hypothetical protein